VRSPCLQTGEWSLIRDVGNGAVKLGKANRKLFVKGRGLVLKEADRRRLPQYHRHVAVAAPVNSGVDPMTERNVVSELVQFAIYGELIPVRTCVGHQREPVICRHKRIGDHEISVEEEFQNGNAGPRDNAVARGVGGMCWRALGKGLRPQDNFLFTTIGDAGHDAFNRILSLLTVAQIATMLVALIFARHWLSRSRKYISSSLVAWAAVAALLMISASSLLWTHLPKLQFLQFPWRWLLCLNVAFALLVAAAWKSNAVRVVICVAMLGILVFGAWHIQRPW